MINPTQSKPTRAALEGREAPGLLSLVLGSGMGAGVMEILARQRSYSPIMLFDDPFEELRSIRSVLNNRSPIRRLPRIGRYRGKPSSVPTSKHSKVKAARKANLRRMQSC